MVEGKLPGVSFPTDTFMKLEPSTQSAVVGKLAHFLAALHAQDIRKYPLADNKHGDRIISRFDEYIKKFETIDPLAVSFALDTAETISKMTTRIGQSIALLHGDFVLANFLFDTDTKLPLGVVDFTASWIGDINWDFTLISESLGKSYFLMLIELYEERSGNEVDPVVIDCYRRTQLCHFLYWIDQEKQPKILAQMARYRPVT
jgi:aminoglycoside phosphotransferase (APT) family kinase protein